MASPNAERLAENVWTRLISRGAMILCAAALPLVVAVGKDYLNTQNNQIASIVNHQVVQDAKIGELSDRLIRIETDRARGMLEYARWQGQLSSKLEDMSKSVNELNNAMAGLKATVESLKERMDTQLRRLGMNDGARP